MIQVTEVEQQAPFRLYASKPKYPLHITVLTSAQYSGYITGMQQSFLGKQSSWQYQLTSIDGDTVVSSWWEESDIVKSFGDIYRVDEWEESEILHSSYLGSLVETCKFVKEYGENALEQYHATGRRRELHFHFWDLGDAEKEKHQLESLSLEDLS